MDKVTSLFKALSDRNRLRIVAAPLKQDELCACQVTELIQVTGAKEQAVGLVQKKDNTEKNILGILRCLMMIGGITPLFK